MSQTVTSNLDIPLRAGDIVNLPIAAGVHLYAGTMIALVIATGFITFSGDDAGKINLGRCEFEVDNTADGTGGAQSTTVARGVFLYTNSSRSSAAYALTNNNVGQLCYVENEQTVQTFAGSTNKIVAGSVVAVTSAGVWVDTRRAISLANIAFTSDAITDSTGGVAATPSAGAITVAAIASATSDTTAASKLSTAAAFATLILELKKVQADLATLKSASV